MATIRVISSRGDVQARWDIERAETGDGEAQAAVLAAERIFQRERARGATAFRLQPGEPAERIDHFDWTAEQIVVVPRVTGG
ncbi:MAG: hypothetical protein CL878_05645 [Dehalococcoidia bacterium]|nr:hypothetical protein [Dehalococcoidia bacterium]